MTKKKKAEKHGKVTPRLSGANCSTASISELIVLSEIREAIGCGARPMQSELVEIIIDLVVIARKFQKEHAELKKFTAGFGNPDTCECEPCVRARRIFQ